MASVVAGGSLKPRPARDAERQRRTGGNFKNESGFAGQGNSRMLYADPDTGEINRFLVGPKECEVTGPCRSMDRKTMFVGLQHPGDKGGGGTTRCSTVSVVTRADGSEIG